MLRTLVINLQIIHHNQEILNVATGYKANTDVHSFPNLAIKGILNNGTDLRLANVGAMAEDNGQASVQGVITDLKAKTAALNLAIVKTKGTIEALELKIEGAIESNSHIQENINRIEDPKKVETAANSKALNECKNMVHSSWFQDMFNNKKTADLIERTMQTV